MTKYAFLYSGGGNEKYNHSRYANDLGFAYKVLIEKYHYSKENITVMYADGSAVQYDELTINTSPAKEISFLAKMREYGEAMHLDDLFTFIVSNHGGNNGELFSWDEKIPIQMTNVIKALNNIECKKNYLDGAMLWGELYISQD